MNKISQKIQLFCKYRNLRCPAKKLIVADQLQSLDDYVEAGKIFLDLRNSGRKISIATVYQSLVWLTDNGFAERDPGSSGSVRYRVVKKDSF